MQFKITGNPIRNRFWKWINKISINRIKRTEDNVVDVKSVNFPSAYSILIRYEIININEKYEIVVQGDYVSYYKNWKEMDEPVLGSVSENELEIIIRANHKGAKKVGY